MKDRSDIAAEMQAGEREVKYFAQLKPKVFWRLLLYLGDARTWEDRGN